MQIILLKFIKLCRNLFKFGEFRWSSCIFFTFIELLTTWLTFSPNFSLSRMRLIKILVTQAGSVVDHTCWFYSNITTYRHTHTQIVVEGFCRKFSSCVVGFVGLKFVVTLFQWEVVFSFTLYCGKWHEFGSHAWNSIVGWILMGVHPSFSMRVRRKVVYVVCFPLEKVLLLRVSHSGSR